MRQYPYDLSNLIQSKGSFVISLVAWMNIFQDLVRGLLGKFYLWLLIELSDGLSLCEALHTLNIVHCQR